MKPVQQFLKDWEVIFPKTDGEYSGYWLTNPNGQKVNIEFYLERFFEEYGDKSFIGRRKLSDLSILNLTEEEIEEVLLKFKEGVYLNIPNFIGSLMTEEEYKQIIANMKSCGINPNKENVDMSNKLEDVNNYIRHLEKNFGNEVRREDLIIYIGQELAKVITSEMKSVTGIKLPELKTGETFKYMGYTVKII